MNTPVTQKASPRFFNNPKNRALIYQCALLLGLGYFFYNIINNALANMAALGIQSGYGFLSSVAGFDIVMSLIDYDSTSTYSQTFIVGLLNTLLVCFISIILCTLLGFILGIAYFSKNWLIHKLSIIYVEIFRNIPILLQMFFWYFVVLATLPSARNSLDIANTMFLNIRGLYIPALSAEAGANIVYASIVVAMISIMVLKRWAKTRQLQTGNTFPIITSSIGLLLGLPLLTLVMTQFPFSWDVPQLKGFNFSGGITIIPELMALTLALSIYSGAFVAEAVRAGIQSVARGQIEAANSLGLTQRQMMSLIIVPQALRVIIPILNSEYQTLVKNSTLAAAIGYPGLFSVFAGTALNQTGQAIEIITMTLAVYFTINMTISLLMNCLASNTALEQR